MTNNNTEKLSAPPGAWTMAPFLFFSGLCALVYQIGWMREFRLIFGASTAASAAVVAIFIGGLGVGGIIIGKRVDKHPRPLMLYGWMEVCIAVGAALSPFLLSLIRWVYLSAGGTTTMGMIGGTIVRLVLATLVLGVPTFLMGGTLPAAVRAITTEDDRGRRRVALLYGINTMGAVLGSALATFYMIEQYGTRATMWFAALINLGLGALVISRAKKQEPQMTQMNADQSSSDAEEKKSEAPSWFVLPAAAVVGFAFFLMEMIWYRMLSPILGGSVFTFGLILCLVLLGIGIGGLLYAMQSAGRPARLWVFAMTCLLEATFVMVAYAMGDRLAWVANSLQAWSVFGFAGLAAGWTIVAGIAVLPAAIVAGYQFPLLIALLGEGKKGIGGHVGAAYAWNTAGAIVGSLAGGFVLLPMMGALGCWQMVGILLGLLGLWAIIMGLGNGQLAPAIAPMAMACLVLALCTLPEGPTAAWRHSGVGVGRVSFNRTPSANEFREWRQDQRLWVQKEMEGVESCVGIENRDGLAFIVNGKVDGNAVGDCGTQVMLGLLGAMMHDSPKSAAVVGLGGGSTAGWLGAVPSIQRVDVVELEPAVLEYARMCTAVNRGVMSNPKVHISIGDAREYLMTTRQRYDLVVSEPSNPYRAGIATLFTKEYYESAAARMEEKGIFVQWVQSYNVDSRTVQTIYATLLSVFPHVETWSAAAGDMLLVASKKPIEHDIGRLSKVVTEEPYRSGLAWTWSASGVEGLYAHYVVNADFARFFTDFPGIKLNTDDRTLIEFGFARAANMPTRFSMNELREAARAMGQHRPKCSDGAVDWDRVEEEMAECQIFEGSANPVRQQMGNEQMQRLLAVRKYMEGDLASAAAAWRSQPREPRGPIELVAASNALAAQGDENAVKYIEQLRQFQPVEADVVLGRLRIRQGKTEAGADALIAAFTRFHEDPWPKRLAMRRGLMLVNAVGRSNPVLAKRLGEVLRTPFAASSQNETRQEILVQLANSAHDLPMLVDALGQYEPYFPWKGESLAARANAYKAAGIKLQGRANMELSEFRTAQGETVLDDVMAASSAPTDSTKGTAMIEK